MLLLTVISCPFIQRFPMKKQQRLCLGAHLSITNGFDQAIQEAVKLGCTALQIFTKSNRQWYAKELDTLAIEAFQTAQANNNITPVVAHASYLINIGSADAIIRSKSVEALLIELERCSALSIPYLVIHPGSHVNTDETACLDTIAQSINELFKQYTGDTMMLLETASGQGSTVCYRLEQLNYIVKRVIESKRIGICVDTCHIFAAGYDISTQQGYANFWTTYDQVLGLESLRVIHVNDSKKPCGSFIDRHEHIGQGFIGIETFKRLMNDERFFDSAKILETPIDEKGNFATNLAILKGLLSEETKKLLNYAQETEDL